MNIFKYYLLIIFLVLFVEQGVMNIICILICRIWALDIIIVFEFVPINNYSLHSALVPALASNFHFSKVSAGAGLHAS